MKPLVSILIPAYNAANLIADTLRSALAQTWERKEIIVVDDGSRDQTLLVARQFESRGVRVVSQENQGAATARNSLLALSRGDYLQWLDADDLLSPGKISLQMAAIESAPDPTKTLFSSGWAFFLYRPERARFVPTPLWCDLTPAEWLIRKMGQNLHMQTATWLTSRQLAEAAGPWDRTMLSDDDGEYFCRVLQASNGVKFVPDARVYYRASGPGSLSYIGNSRKKQDAQWVSMQLSIRCLLSYENSERSREACLRYLQNWVFFFHPERPDLLAEMGKKANELGGTLTPPPLSWKYAWIKTLFGWDLAKRARFFLPGVKWSVLRNWDKMRSHQQGVSTL
jgi:glycosyltransferase involved in cell wall biosynthesis